MGVEASRTIGGEFRGLERGAGSLESSIHHPEIPLLLGTWLSTARASDFSEDEMVVCM